MIVGVFIDRDRQTEDPVLAFSGKVRVRYTLLWLRECSIFTNTREIICRYSHRMLKSFPMTYGYGARDSHFVLSFKSIGFRLFKGRQF